MDLEQIIDDWFADEVKHMCSVYFTGCMTPEITVPGSPILRFRAGLRLASACREMLKREVHAAATKP